ncbi:hypothetical protein GCM10027275_19590 [Rhabdobacter roseus]|uniref:Opacity protein-like surface antigen n=1 Tax=Rhabdobacter roseus TaxID=1655419 RepID=A0A840TLT6_9BACT|nr:outer membrane beta-barrel protein [Rhabdobacter roseus]MBB5283885.1 opacity protein-like surface antigen [Rhabdobacter roseus]
MKKPCTLFILCFLISLTTYAQTDQGTWLVGLSGNGSFQKDGLNRLSQVQLAPQLGYFVARNLALGAQLSLDQRESRYRGNTTLKSHATSAYGQARYYIGNAKLKPYATILAGYGWNRGHGLDGTGDLVRFRGDDGWQAAAGAGLAYFVGPQIALEAEAHYRFLNHGRFDRDRSATTLRLGIALYW